LTPLFDNIRQTSARADQTLANLDSTLSENRTDLRVSVSEFTGGAGQLESAIEQIQGVREIKTRPIF